MSVVVKVFNEDTELDHFATTTIADLAGEAVRKRNECHLVLSGGGTPVALYRLMGQKAYERSFPWSQIHLYWGDERLVPPDDSGSNYGQVKAVLLDKVPIPLENVHRIKGELSPAEAATDYRSQLMNMAKSGLPWPVFDIVLLGLGADGHFASIFPGSLPIREKQRSVVVVQATYEDRPAHRISLTLAVFNSAKNILILVKGSKKAGAVAAAIRGPRDEIKWPIQRLKPETGDVLWLLDKEAAQDL